MKEVHIRIEGKFGSKFQEQFARDSLMSVLKAWRGYVRSTHKKNELKIIVNGSEIQHLDWFNWIETK